MREVIAEHVFKNGKAIRVGITDEAPNSVDDFFLSFDSGLNSTTHYVRPDEAVLIAKLLTELVLKRVVTYEVNLGETTDKDY